MQAPIALPASVRRLVILGGCSGANIEVAASFHTSPFFAQQQIVLWTHSTQTENATREIDFVSRAVQIIDDQTTTTTANVPPLMALLKVANQQLTVSHPLKLDNFTPDVASDLFVYVPSSSVRSGASGEDLAKLLPQSTAGGMCVVIATNEAYPAVTASFVRHKVLSMWKVVTIRVPFLGPPALNSQQYPRFHDELTGPLENVCLGVALGVVKQLKVSAGQAAGIIPLDLAINTALLSLCLFLTHQVPSSLREKNLMEVAISSPADSALVWGMIGEYIIDYYGRYLAEINKKITVGMFAADPACDFQVYFPDLWNYGMAFTTPIIKYRNYYASQFQRSHLKRFPHSATMERMQRLLGNIDTALDSLPPPPSRIQEMMANIQQASGNVASGMGATRNNTNHGCNPEKGVVDSSSNSNTALGSSGLDNSMYLLLLRMLSRGGPLLTKWLPYVSLEWVQWEMYVKRVCVSVLNFTVRYVLDIRKPVDLPQPTRMYHNDLIFTGDDRSPGTNLWLRRLFPDLHWALRCGQQPNGLNIRLHPGGTEQRRLAILAQPHIQLLINQLAREQNVAKSAIEQRAHAILRGIGDTLNHQQLRTLGLIIRKVFMTLYDRINLNSEAYDRLFAAFRQPRCSVVIIPAHRSYIDFLVVSYLLTMMGFPSPHICSGEDFLRLGGVAELLRGSGAFFMRRSFRSDRLYGALFKEFIRHLIRDGECVEFFVEGMRSRTQKTMPPKVGILKFITDAFFEKQDEIDDVLFLPVGLSYEKILEGNVYAEELMGIPKPQETIGNLLKSASILKNKYGALNVVVGDFISLKSFANDPHQVPPGFERASENERVSIRSTASSVTAGGGTYTPIRTLASLAWRITYEIQKNLVVTPTALLAAVVQCMTDTSHLRSSGVPVASIASNVEWVRSAVLHRGGKMNAQFAVCDGSQLMTYALKHLQPRLWVSPLSHVFVNEEMLATSQMLFSIYSNQLLHLFADEAVLVVCAFAFGQQRGGGGSGDGIKGSSPDSHHEHAAGSHSASGDFVISVGELKQKCKIVRQLLAHEIPNYQKPCPISLDSWLSVALNNLFDDNRSIRRLPLTDAADEEISFVRSQFTLFVAQLLYPFIESHFIVLAAMTASLKNFRPRIDESHLMRLSHEGALALVKSKNVSFVQSSSKEGLKNCINSYLESGVITAETNPAVMYNLRAPRKSSLTSDNLQKLSQPQVNPAVAVSASREALPITVEEWLALVNGLRWRPGTSDNVASIVDELQRLYASFATALTAAKL